MNFLKIRMAILQSFRNARATNKGEQHDFAHCNPKIGCHGNVPWAIGKDGHIGNLRSNTYHTMKMWWTSVQ